MKYFSVCLTVFLIVLGICVAAGGGEEKREILRVHIRANSNSEDDQNVKYAVKDAVVKYLTPMLEDVTSISEAERIVASRLSEIREVANGVLKGGNFGYTGHAELRREQFPTRVYDGITFDSGEYTALILELGSGKGDNWWCVMYPPLCFINAEGNGKIKYKSIIEEFFKR